MSISIEIHQRSYPDRLFYLADKLDEIAERGEPKDALAVAFCLWLFAEEMKPKEDVEA